MARRLTLEFVVLTLLGAGMAAGVALSTTTPFAPPQMAQFLPLISGDQTIGYR
jgi:hypothetical protein